jgi:NDP-sugar pyrophosphorylase family protein
MDLSYYRDGTPRGAAGCVRDAAALCASDCFVVTDGTAIPTVDLHKLLEAHRGSGAAATAVVHGERAGSGSPTPGGVYVFERRVLEHVAENGFQDIKENLIPRLHRAGEQVMAFEDPGFCPHVLNAQTYLAVNQWMIQRLAAAAADGDAPPIHPLARVERGARLVGPVLLGAGARVRAGATLVGPTSIGADSTVEADALVACSAVWSRCSVGAGAIVHGSVIGHETAIPPGSRLFNAVWPRLAVEQRPAVLLLDWGRPSKVVRVTAAPLAGSLETTCAIG